MNIKNNFGNINNLFFRKGRDTTKTRRKYRFKKHNDLKI